MLRLVICILICSAVTPLKAKASPICAHFLSVSSNVDYSAWENFRRPHKNISEVERLIPAFGTITTFNRIFAIGREQSLKSRDQRKQEGRLFTGQHLGGSRHSSYLVPIKPNSRFLYYSLEMFGLYIVFTNELLHRRDYYYNSGADYGHYFAPGSENPSGARGDWDTQKLSKGIYPGEVLFENEISLPEYAAAVIIPPGYKRIFQAMSLANGISWKKMGVKVVYSDRLPPQSEIDALISEKLSWRNRDPLVPDHDAHKAIRTSLDLNAPTFADQYNYIQSSKNWSTELGQKIQEHFKLNISDKHFKDADMIKIFQHLETQLKTGAVNWHWFNMFNIKFTDEQSQAALRELLLKYGHSLDDVQLFKEQPIPFSVKLWVNFRLESHERPEEYRNLDLSN